MTGIVQAWLAKRLGTLYYMDPHYFGHHVLDGTLIAKLLHSYDVINIDQLNLIQPTNLSEKALQNLHKIKNWLIGIGITCTDLAIADISKGRGLVSITLLYELYVRLENPLFFSEENLLVYVPQRYKITKISENLDDKRETLNPLAIPLIEKEDIVEWYRIKHRALVERYKASRENLEKLADECHKEFVFRESSKYYSRLKYNKHVEKEQVKQLPYDVTSGHETVSSTSEIDLVFKSEKDSATFQLCCGECGKDYATYVKKRIKKDPIYKAFRIDMKKTLNKDLWDEFFEEEENEFNISVAKKLLKLSRYEKQMVTKLHNIHNEKNVIIKNRAVMGMKEQKMLEKVDFLHTFRHDNRVEDEKFELEIARKINIELNMMLNEELSQLSSANKYNICMDIVSSLVDMAVDSVEYAALNDGIVPPCVWGEWKALFLAGQSIIPEVLRTERDIENEKLRQAVLDEYDFNEYLNLVGQWCLEDLCPESDCGEEYLTTLGYIVHRILNLTNPLPVPPLPPDVPLVNIAAAAVGINDDYVIPVLRELLMKQEICVVELDTAIYFCLEQFKKEYKDEFLTDTGFIQINNNNNTDLENNEQESECVITHSSGIVLDVNPNLEPDISKPEKCTQTPRNIPEDDPDENAMTPVAKLGQKAFLNLGIGEPIDDSLLCEMIIEQLKENKNAMKGWVIINYPPHYAGAVALEGSFSDTKMPPVKDLMTIEKLEGVQPRAIRVGTSEVQNEKKFQVSRILPNPIPEPILDPPKTYLTSYISVKKEKPLAESEDDKKQKSSLDENEDTSSSLAEGEDEFDKKEKLPLTESKDEFDKIEMLPLTESKDEFDKIEMLSLDESENEKETSSENEFESKTEIVKEEEELHIPIQFHEERNLQIELFYSDQGIYHPFYYKEFNFATIKRLARTIIGDLQAPSVELFGEVVEELAEELEGISKIANLPSSVKPLSVLDGEIVSDMQLIPLQEILEEGKRGGSGEDVNKPSRENEEETEMLGLGDIGQGDIMKTEIVESSQEEITKLELPSSHTETEIKPEDNGERQYVNMNIPETISKYLASLWVNVEETYIKDFKRVFYMKRLQYSAMLPYINFVKDYLVSFIERGDDKQQHVESFQIEFNDIDEDLRKDKEIKCELHCRISELQDLLLSICDERKRESENKREAVINDNWLTKELTVLTNIFLRVFQLEVDRCVYTLQYANDYYYSMIDKLPSLTRLVNIYVPQLLLFSEDNLAQKSDISVQSQPKTKKSESREFIDGSEFKEIINNSLVTCKEITTPFHDVISDNMTKLESAVDKLLADFQHIIAKEDEILNPKVQSKGNKAKDKDKKKKKELPPQNVVEENIAKSPTKLLCEEWLEVVHNATSRTKFRLRLNKEKAFRELSVLQEKAQHLFSLLFNKINTTHEQEVTSISALCKLLRHAIEREIPIQQKLVLDRDEFFILPDVLMYPNPPEPPPPKVVERIVDDEFRIIQLDNLMEVLFKLSPSGVITERAFACILEDIIACLPDDREVRMLPNLWYTLRLTEIPILIKKIYGDDVVLLDWKHFLIHGLNIEVPSMDEIVYMRNAFRAIDYKAKETVSLEDYQNISLWFERGSISDPQEKVRCSLAKDFLFGLFQLKDDTVNYKELLLYLCKDEDPILGLAKAIALCLGGKVFVSSDEYADYLVMEEDEKKYRAAKMEIEKQTLVQNILSDIVTDVTIYDSVEVIDFLKSSSSEEIKEEEISMEQSSEEETDLEVTSSTSINVVTPTYKTHVSYDILLTIFNVLLPKSTKLQEKALQVTNIFDMLREAYSKLYCEGSLVYVHEFLELQCVADLLSKVNVFTYVDISKEIEDILVNRKVSVPNLEVIH